MDLRSMIIIALYTHKRLYERALERREQDGGGVGGKKNIYNYTTACTTREKTTWNNL
jgi:hypothetical protein